MSKTFHLTTNNPRYTTNYTIKKRDIKRKERKQKKTLLACSYSMYNTRVLAGV